MKSKKTEIQNGEESLKCIICKSPDIERKPVDEEIKLEK